jgi:SAM-dependent methyltransferase
VTNKNGLDTTAAEAYEKHIFPAFMLPLMKTVFDAAAPRPGEHILDVACGTGLVARLAAPLVAPGGSVTNLDFDPAMIAVGRHLVEVPSSVSISWHCASALSMPFEAATYDLAFCLNGLQFLPDQAAGLTEMRRVLKPGARLILTVLSSVDRCKGHSLVLRGLERRGIDPAPMLKAFVLGDPGKLDALVRGAGFHDLSIQPVSATVRFPSARHFVDALAGGAVATRHALSRLPELQRAEFLQEMDQAFGQYTSATGIATPQEQLLLVASGA